MYTILSCGLRPRELRPGRSRTEFSLLFGAFACRGFFGRAGLVLCGGLAGGEAEVHAAHGRERYLRGILEVEEAALVRAYLGLVEHAGAAVLGVVGVYELAQHARLGQSDGEAVVAHGREVQRADYVGAARHAHEGHAAAVAVVDVQPLEAVPAVVYAPEAGRALVYAAEVADVAAHRVVHRVLEQVPVELLLVVPLYELRKLAAHEHQLLAGVGKLIAVERAQRGELGLVVAPHLVHHAGLAVHDLVVREGEDEVLGEGVHHREGDAAVVLAAEVGVHGHVVERVVHEAHVPLEGEAQAADVGRAGDKRIGRTLLGDADRAGVGREYGGVELAQEIHRAVVYVAAVLVGRPLAAAPAVVEIEHAAHGVDADAVYVVLVKEEHRRADEEALHLGLGVVEDHRAPVRVLCHAPLAALIAGGAVKEPEPVLVAREVRGDVVHYDAYALAVELVHEVHEVLRGAVAAGGGEVARDLIAPGALEGVLRDGHYLHVGEAHLVTVVRQLIRHVAVVGEGLVLALAPGAEVHLVYVHGGVYGVIAAAAGHVLAVCPLKAVYAPDLAARGGTGLGVQGKGVGLEHHGAVLSDDAELIYVSLLHSGEKSAPHPSVELGHRRGGAVPAVEVADYADLARVRRPDGKARQIGFGEILACEGVIRSLRAAGVEQPDVVIGYVFLCELDSILIHK